MTEQNAESVADHEHVYRCQDCGEIGRAPYDDVDLCAILGHDPYTDEPNHCGRCDALIDGEVS